MCSCFAKSEIFECYRFLPWILNYELRKRWDFWALPGLPWAGPGRRSGHLSARSVNFRICRNFNAGQPGTASRRLPLSRLHLLSRIGLRLNKFDSFGARASSSLTAFRQLARRRHALVIRRRSFLGFRLAALAPRTESVQIPVPPIIPHSPQKSRYSPENDSTEGKKHSPHSRKKHSTVSRVQNIVII